MLSSPTETRASLILRLPDAADVAAWDELVAIYAPLVYRSAIRRGMQPADADDLVQEVFAAIARSVSNWLDRSDRGSFRAWLLAIARNVAINHLTRRHTRSIGAGGEEAVKMMAAMPANESTVSSQFDLDYRREVFRWAAAKVRDSVHGSTWRAFQLTHIEGLSIDDAAAKLNVSVGTIYAGRSRVMNRLQELVKQYEMQ
jgi:RNA polymerase sigma-70 factor (ECF subfamily)